jgi:hypothetical protein
MKPAAGDVPLYRDLGKLGLKVATNSAEKMARRAYQRAWFGPSSGPDLARL